MPRLPHPFGTLGVVVGTTLNVATLGVVVGTTLNVATSYSFLIRYQFREADCPRLIAQTPFNISH